MVNAIDGLLSTGGIKPTTQVGNNSQNSKNTTTGIQGQSDFETLLKSQLNREPSVRMSVHAQKRIQSRNINFGAEETVRLEQAVDKAANKGSREALILMDDLAMVVSIQNRVVITAVDANNRKDDVFTNIDSVVLT